jgi:predicted AAA+ superfamily ATPase
MAQYYRGQYIDQLLKLKDKHYIKVLTGIRRSGKSTILSQFQEKIKTDLNIKPEQIIKYDFNDPNNLQLTYLEIYNTIIKKAVKNKMNYVFLDEVQEIKE